MTKREFFVKVSEGEMTEEMKDFAVEQLVKMDAQLAARKGKISEKEQAKRDANEALARRVAAEVLGAEAKTATDVAAELTEMLGDNTNVYITVGEQQAILKVDSHDTPEMGADLTFSIPYSEVYLFDGETEMVINEE